MSDNSSTNTWDAAPRRMHPIEYASKMCLNLAITIATVLIIGDLENVERFWGSTWRDIAQKQSNQWFTDHGYDLAQLAIYYVCTLRFH